MLLENASVELDSYECEFCIWLKSLFMFDRGEREDESFLEVVLESEYEETLMWVFKTLTN